MNPSKDDHNNWLTVGEIVRLLKEPVALYTNHIVQRWHAQLTSGPCRLFNQCQSPVIGRCSKKNNLLCPSCDGWYKELAKSHRGKARNKHIYRENCDASKWPNDPWEVAKFFMSSLGDNRGAVKDAESTDLSSLLNVLCWMKDAAFAPDRRVDLNLVRQLSSNVRKPWAHAPDHELPEAKLNEAFDAANKFAADLNNVFSNIPEVMECISAIKTLQANKLIKVTETDWKNLNLLRVEREADVREMTEKINGLEEEIKCSKEDKKVITNLEEELANSKAELKSLQDLVMVNTKETGQYSQISCIPDKPPTFVGREANVKEIITSLAEEKCGIVSIVGGPGFGKTTVAIQVSHQIKDDPHCFLVIFSYLNVSRISEVKRRLCVDIGLTPGEDPESALMLWAKSIGRHVVLVMDNIEQLLEGDMKSQFTELILTLRKNSERNVQVLTTTRTEFSIRGETTKNYQISELDDTSSVELLRTIISSKDVQLEDWEVAAIPELAQRCGFVPLALCIAGSLVGPDLGPSELIQWLNEQRLEVLEPVEKAIDCSFQRLTPENKKWFVRLSVFNGNFQRKSAQEVIQKDGFKTYSFLSSLTAQSLLQSSGDKRFVIHPLIRQFLIDLYHDELRKEKIAAQGLMVKHFLEVCHSLTVDCYSKNKFTIAREALKNDAHNVQEILKICSEEQGATNSTSSILEVLTSSDIYKSSSRFFYDFCWNILPRTVLRNFFERCIEEAKRRQQRAAIEITFKYLVADQEGRQSGWSSDEYFERMDNIVEMLQENKTELKEDRFLITFCCRILGRYNYAKKAKKKLPCDFLSEADLDEPVSRSKVQNPFEKVNEAHILKERGHLHKKFSSGASSQNKEEHMNRAKSFYNQALMVAKESLGDNELTCILHKVLGDFCYDCRKYEEALTYYLDAIKLREKLNLDSDEQFVFLLKNYGGCLSLIGRFDEAVEILNVARDIADKLTEKHLPCRARVYYELAILYDHWHPGSQEAADYAQVAIKMKKLLHNPRNVLTLEDIIKKTN